MTANEYQELALRTANPETNKTPDEMMVNAALGMAGEAGEVCEIIKKVKYQGHPIDNEHLLKECGDVLWYVSLMITALGYTMEDAMVANIEKLKKRYPDRFTVDSSLNRDAEDI